MNNTSGCFKFSPKQRWLHQECVSIKTHTTASTPPQLWRRLVDRNHQAVLRERQSRTLEDGKPNHAHAAQLGKQEGATRDTLANRASGANSAACVDGRVQSLRRTRQVHVERGPCSLAFQAGDGKARGNIYCETSPV